MNKKQWQHKYNFSDETMQIIENILNEFSPGAIITSVEDINNRKNTLDFSVFKPYNQNKQPRRNKYES